MSAGVPVVPGDMIIVNIEGFGHPGWGIGKFLGFTVFVPGSLPGETVQVNIDQVKKSFAVGSLLRILNPSPLRTEARCRVYQSCGGCHIQHGAYQYQLELKQKMVQDTLERIGKFSGIQVNSILGMDDPWHYRNRVQFHVRIANNMVEIGFFRPGTHHLIPVEECFLLPNIFNQISLFLRKKLQENIDAAVLSGLTLIVLKISSMNGEIAGAFVTSSPDEGFLDKIIRDLIREFPQVVSLVQNINRGNSGAVFGPEWKLIFGKDRIEDKIKGVLFSISPGSFVQVNPQQTEVLYEKVLDYADLKGSETVLDVYCGIGTISLLLARKTAKVIGIEDFTEAVKDAELNARLNGIKNTEFIEGKAEALLLRLYSSGIRPDLIVVDPPRKGCHPSVLKTIAGMNPSRVIYVSCDPGTLARDLKALGERGYIIKEVQPVDMFPQTYHVECVVLMSRVKE